MPVIDLGDFSKVGTVPAEGIYRVLVENRPKVKPNKAGDGHNIIVNWKITDAPTGAEEFENFDGTSWLSLKVTARAMLKFALESFFQKSFEDENFSIKIDDDDELIDPDFEGVTVLAHLIPGTYNNKPNINVKAWYPDDGETEIQVFSVTAEGDDF
jgi:hypothetical protein